MFGDVIDSVLNGQNLFRGIIGDFDGKFFFKSHNQFDGIQTVCVQIVDEAGRIRDFGRFDAQMFDDNLLYAFGKL